MDHRRYARLQCLLHRWYNCNHAASLANATTHEKDGILKKMPLELLTFQLADLGKVKGTMDQPTCVVCLSEFTAGDLVSQLPCEHLFHADCVHDWLRLRGRCPYRCAEPAGRLCLVLDGHGPGVLRWEREETIETVTPLATTPPDEEPQVPEAPSGGSSPPQELSPEPESEPTLFGSEPTSPDISSVPAEGEEGPTEYQDNDDSSFTPAVPEESSIMAVHSHSRRPMSVPRPGATGGGPFATPRMSTVRSPTLPDVPAEPRLDGALWRFPPLPAHRELSPRWYPSPVLDSDQQELVGEILSEGALYSRDGGPAVLFCEQADLDRSTSASTGSEASSTGIARQPSRHCTTASRCHFKIPRVSTV